MSKTATFTTVGNPAKGRKAAWKLKYKNYYPDGKDLVYSHLTLSEAYNIYQHHLETDNKQPSNISDGSWRVSKENWKWLTRNQKAIELHGNPNERLSQIAKCKRLLAESDNDEITFSNREKIEFDVRNPTITTDEVKKRLSKSFDNVGKLVKLDAHSYLAQAGVFRRVSLIPYKGFTFDVGVFENTNSNYERFVQIQPLGTLYLF